MLEIAVCRAYFVQCSVFLVCLSCTISALHGIILFIIVPLMFLPLVCLFAGSLYVCVF